MYHDNEEWCKIWRGIDLSFENWHEEFEEFWPEHSKVLKICTLMGSFWTKYIIIELKRYRGVIFHDTEEWCTIWRKTDLWFGKWYQEFDKLSPGHSKVSKLGLWWDPFIQSKKCVSLKFTEELCIVTMKNDAKFEEELTGCFKIDTIIWQILTGALKCLKILHFNSLLLTKVYNVWAKKVQKSFVWWHWRLMQNLKETWLVLPKITWWIWQIFSGWKIAISF